MGRPRGDPSDQAARGYPGQRKSKTEKAIAEAERQAKLLALPRAEETSDSPPAHLTDPRLAPAMAVWKEYAPRLDKLHLLARLERHTFALFCVYAGEFVVANEDVLVKGYSTRVKTASGDYMLRENPPCRGAISRPSDLSGKFGLMPSDRNKLLRDGALQFDSDHGQCGPGLSPCRRRCRSRGRQSQPGSGHRAEIVLAQLQAPSVWDSKLKEAPIPGISRFTNRPNSS